jgi:hypothetical protein
VDRNGDAVVKGAFVTDQRREAYVMVSFAAEDSARVDQLLKLFKKYDIKFFEYRRGIRPGENIIDT